MSTITWQVESLSCVPQSEGQADVVVSVAWRVNGVDGIYNATVYGTQTLTPSDSKEFIAYADLTETQVIGWVQDAMGEDQVADINANIEGQIENQVNPPITTPTLPWLSQVK